MAKALQCPNCRARYPIADLGNEPTFLCGQCGQILKVPQAVAQPDNNGGGTAVFGSAPPAAAPAPPAPAPPAPDPDQSGSDGKSSKKTAKKKHRAARKAEKTRAPDHVPWPLRLLAWLVALPLGAVIVVFPARRFGLLTTFDLADVIIGTGTGRYARLAVVVVLWALAAAILVQVFLVGGRALVNRYRKAPKEDRAAKPVRTPKPARARRDRRSRAPELEPLAPAAAKRPARPTARSSQRLRSTAGRRTGS